MRAVRTVLVKEMVDNLRDRRTVASTLLLGPLLGPLVFGFVLWAALERAEAEQVRAVALPIAGAERAPNLVSFLRQHGVRVQPAPADAEAAVRAREHDLVLVIPERFAAALRAGRPAPVRLVVAGADARAAPAAARVRALLLGYGDQLGRLRLLARGVDPVTIDAVALETVDVSTPEARSVLLLGLVPYFLVFSMLIGGFYLAVDTTPGERERGSLEALLASPVPRHELLLGKLAATFVFSVVSLTLAALGFAACLARLQLENLGVAPNLGPGAVAAILIAALPFALLASALLAVVSVFARSVKEAQTYLSALLLVPLVPVLLNVFFPVKTLFWMMCVPGLSQHLLITNVLGGTPLAPAQVAASAATTLALAAALAALAARLYEREGLVG